MTIDLSPDIECQLKEAALAQGVSPGQYVERLVVETKLRQMQVSEFKAAIAERIASLDAGNRQDGEEVMARLVSDLASE